MFNIVFSLSTVQCIEQNCHACTKPCTIHFRCIGTTWEVIIDHASHHVLGHFSHKTTTINIFLQRTPLFRIITCKEHKFRASPVGRPNGRPKAFGAPQTLFSSQLRRPNGDFVRRDPFFCPARPAHTLNLGRVEAAPDTPKTASPTRGPRLAVRQTMRSGGRHQRRVPRFHCPA